jgi:hypothetical protein
MLRGGVPGSLVGVVLLCAPPTSGRTFLVPPPLPAIAACAIFLGAYVLIATERWATLWGSKTRLRALNCGFRRRVRTR